MRRVSKHGGDRDGEQQYDQSVQFEASLLGVKGSPRDHWSSSRRWQGNSSRMFTIIRAESSSYRPAHHSTAAFPSRSASSKHFCFLPSGPRISLGRLVSSSAGAGAGAGASRSACGFFTASQTCRALRKVAISRRASGEGSTSCLTLASLTVVISKAPTRIARIVTSHFMAACRDGRTANKAAGDGRLRECRERACRSRRHAQPRTEPVKIISRRVPTLKNWAVAALRRTSSPSAIR